MTWPLSRPPRTPVAPTGDEWQPGDPLHRRENHQHSRYLFNYRDDGTDADECKPCPDATSWPVPHNRVLPMVDEIGRFIAEWHVWDQAGRPEATG